MPARYPRPAQSLLRHPSQIPNLFYCPSCRLWRRPLSARKSLARAPALASLGARRYASLASTTAINAPKDVRRDLRELYDALNALKVKGANYVNLSRLGLALRGLETREPVVRVAVLGLDSQATARRLVRILLADPLQAEAKWEKQLETIGRDDGRGILIRYGETEGVSSQSSLLYTLSIPSTTLRKHNVEILISSLSTRFAPTAETDVDFDPLEAILVPAVETPVSAGGRFGVVTYPVHQALLLGDGVSSIVAYGRYAGGKLDPEATGDMIKPVFDLPAPTTPASTSDEYDTVDVELGATSLARFRESVQNAIVYEQGWYRANIPTIAHWLTSGTMTTTSPSALKPTIHTLITSLLTTTTSRILTSETAHLAHTASTHPPATKTRTALHAALSAWAERAHTELRDELDAAFAAPRGSPWRKLAWWKLPWRADDVALVAADLLDTRFLISAERHAIFLAGRVAGLAATPDTLAAEASAADTRAVLDATEPPSTPRLGSSPPPLSTADVLPTTPQDSTDTATTGPWPPHIALARAHLAATSIPRLSALAQTLTLALAARTSIAAALSTLTYISLSPLPVSSPTLSAAATSALDPTSTATALFALGLVWALRRLQRGWERARAAWEADVREEGRRALRDAEAWVRAAVDSVGQDADEGTDAAEKQERGAAREAVERVRRVLDGLQGGERR